MLTTHDIRRRIRSISATAQITKAMQMVASSKMRRAQQAARAGQPFVRLLYRMQRRATMQALDFVHPLVEEREVHKRAVILVGADKGLCGPLNANLFRLAAPFDTQMTLFITAGRRAAQFVARTGRQLVAEFPCSEPPRFDEARVIAGFARDLFLKREVDQVQVLFTRFVNTLKQEPLSLEFLPVGKITALEMEAGKKEEEEAPANGPREFLFEPNPEAVLSFLLSHYLNIYIYQVLLGAKASEQSARMVSMKNATDNAEGLIKDLTLEYNKLRQGNITKELLDIAGGQTAAG